MDEKQPDLEKLYERIRKLTNLKEGAEEVGSMEEAANAQARIQELVLKYNLDMSKVPGNNNKTLEIEIRNYQIKFVKTESDWMYLLLHHIAVNNMGKAVFLNLKNAQHMGYWSVDLIGEKTNIDLIIYIYEQLLVRVKSMRQASFKSVLINENPDIKKNGYFRSYSREVVNAIAWKLRDMKDNLNQKFEGGAGLIIVHDQAIQEKVAEKYGSLRSGGKQSKLGNGYGARDGKRDGHSMQINKGLN